MTTRIKLRRDTKANWADVNPTLAAGEMGLESDTRRTKIGDGLTPWSGLEYTFGDLEVTGKKINGELGVSIASQDPETWISTVKAKTNYAGTTGIAYDSMGNLYISGWEESGYNTGSYDGTGKAFLIKHDSQGGVLWKKYIYLDSYTGGNGVAVDSEDNAVVITMGYSGAGFFAITKYESDGSLVWQKTYTDSYDYAEGIGLAVDGNDDFVVVGTRVDPNHNDNNGIFVMKVLGTTGVISWTRTMGRSQTNAWQPSVAIDGNNNIIMAGMDSWNSDGQATIVKLSSSGSPIWNKTLRNQEDEWDGYELDLGSIDADADGNIYFVGSYVVPDFVTDIQADTRDGRAGLILKMNSDGVVQWSRIVGPGDCSDLGASIVYKEGRLYATFQTERKYYKNDFTRNAVTGYTTQEIVLACYDAANGKVQWQRQFGPEVLWGTAIPTSNPNNGQDISTEQGRLIAVHGDYVAVAGQASEYSRTEDETTRSYAFLAQLPASGEEMDLAGWSYKASKHRGMYAQLQIEDYSDYTVNPTTTITVTGSGEYLPTNTAANVVVELMASGANQWDFKPNGDLALPVGGNIEITRPQQGSINVVGYFDSDNTDGIFNQFHSVTTDADGNQYYVGAWNWHYNSTPNGNSCMPMVVKVNAQGQVEWKVRLSNDYLYTNNAVYGEAHTVAYDPSSGRIVVVCHDSSEGNADQMLIVDLDPVTGKVVEHHRYRGPDDIRANGMVINTLGERFITGNIQGNNYISFTVTNAMVASTSTVDTLMVPRTTFDGHDAPSWLRGTNGWFVNGIGDVYEIDRYNDVSGTVREGSGATFDITIDGSGSITGAVVGAGGVNYQTGHKILIDHLEVDGSNSDSDIILTVTSATNGIIQTVAAGYYGSGGGAPGTWGGTTGTNYQVASGFTVDVQVNSNTATNNLVVYHNAGGNRYVVGDVITFPGTSIGGTSTATDLVITALQVGEYSGAVQSGEGTGYSVTTRGTSPLTYIRVAVSGGPDFSANGPWTLRHYTDANTFLAKFVSTTTNNSLVWAKWIEKSDYDVGVAVDYDSNGNLYWASKIVEETTATLGNYVDQPLIVKLNSQGQTQWAKTYLTDGYEGLPLGLQVDSEDYVVLAQARYTGNSDLPVIQRISSTGTALWTKLILADGAEGVGYGSGGLALDNDDNIYFNVTRHDGQDGVIWVSKLDIQQGYTIWGQDFAQGNNWTNGGFNRWSNGIATDGDKYYLAGMTFDIDGNEGNAFAAALPADGSAADTNHGPFSVNEALFDSDGGWGDGGGLAPVDRDYLITTATNQFTVVTDRRDIQSWIEPGPTSNYPVYTKSDAGIVFGDGTVQTTSGQGLPQVRLTRYNKYTKLKLSDSGKHLYVTNQDQIIEVPTYSEVEFPVGTMITVVNVSGANVYIVAAKDNYRTYLYCPSEDGSEGSSNNLNGWRFYDAGGGNFITLLKVEESYDNGSRWIVNGNNAYNVSDIDPLDP